MERLDDYEIIELTATADGERRRLDPVLPPLNLGDRTSGAHSEPPSLAGRKPAPMWQRAVAVVAALLAGVVVGAYGWPSVQQDDDQVSLVVAAVELTFTRDGYLPVVAGPQQLRVRLFNEGDQDVRVVGARLTGWARPPGAPRFGERVVPAGGSAGVDFRAEPACEGEAPGQVQLDVRTGTGESTVALPLPPDPHVGIVGHLYRQTCQGVAPTLTVDRVSVGRDADGTHVLPMIVRLLSSAPDARITAVSSTTPGFRLEAPTLPKPVAGNAPGTMVDLDWSVVDCAATEGLGEVTIDAEVSTPVQTATLPVSLGRQAIVELASLAGEVCRP